MAEQLKEQIKSVRAALAAIGQAAIAVEFDEDSGTLTAGEYSVYPSAGGGWTIGREVIHRGTRYYPDGSGEDDSSDVVDVEDLKTPGAAPLRIALLMAEDLICGALQCEAEAEAMEPGGESPERE